MTDQTLRPQPLLVTITAPTCAGKTTLLTALTERLGFERVVSTTTRAARAGETEGVDYYFISEAESRALEAAGAFAELIEFNGTRYGVTKAEMDRIAASGRPAVIVLEPKGLEAYRALCRELHWQLLSVYVSTVEAVRVKRLVERATGDVVAAALGGTDPAVAVGQVVASYFRRLTAVLQEERNWSASAFWDVTVDGQNLDRAVDDVRLALELRKRRQSLYL
jgi:guanylate kinase